MIDKLLFDLLLEHIHLRRSTLMQDYAPQFAREHGYKAEILWIVKPRNPSLTKYKVCIYLGPKTMNSSAFRFMSLNIRQDGSTSIHDTHSCSMSEGNDPNSFIFEEFLNHIGYGAEDVIWAA